MNQIHELQTWMDQRADEMAALLMDLVAMDTENPPGRGLGRCARALHDAMERLGFATELIQIPPSGTLEEPCILRSEVGGGPRIVYFHGHYDVVPAQSPAQFEPRRENGRIIGRGTADMKGGLVSMLYGAAAARDLGQLQNGRIVFHIVCDEETGSVAGSGYLREHEMIDPTALAMVTTEPTAGVVWHANRGALTLRVSIRGKSAHVGQAYLGVNAFEQMLGIAQPLVDLGKEMLEQRTSFALEEDDARGSMLVVGGAAGSGANFNVVPDGAWFSVDCRFNPEETLEGVLAQINETITEAARELGADVSVEVLQRQPSASTDVSHPAASMLAHCVADIEGESPRFELCPGVLETRWYAQLGVPAFAYGGGRLDVSHGSNEYIDEGAMRRCATVYAHFAAEMLKSAE